MADTNPPHPPPGYHFLPANITVSRRHKRRQGKRPKSPAVAISSSHWSSTNPVTEMVTQISPDPPAATGDGEAQEQLAHSSKSNENENPMGPRKHIYTSMGEQYPAHGYSVPGAFPTGDLGQRQEGAVVAPDGASMKTTTTTTFSIPASSSSSLSFPGVTDNDIKDADHAQRKHTPTLTAIPEGDLSELSPLHYINTYNQANNADAMDEDDDFEPIEDFGCYGTYAQQQQQQDDYQQRINLSNLYLANMNTPSQIRREFATSKLSPPGAMRAYQPPKWAAATVDATPAYTPRRGVFTSKLRGREDWTKRKENAKREKAELHQRTLRQLRERMLVPRSVRDSVNTLLREAEYSTDPWMKRLKKYEHKDIMDIYRLQYFQAEDIIKAKGWSNHAKDDPTMVGYIVDHCKMAGSADKQGKQE